MPAPRSLEDLKSLLLEDARANKEALDAGEESPGVDWTTLPVFGGPVPHSTNMVWSWDDTRLLVGTCADDLRIVQRGEWNLK